MYGCKGDNVPTFALVVWVKGGIFLNAVCISTNRSVQMSVHVVFTSKTGSMNSFVLYV